MYKVIYQFADLQNGNKVYKVGDEFPSEGVSEERLAELSGTANKIGVPLIEEVRPKASEKAKSLPQRDKEEPKDEIVEKPKKRAKKGNSKE